MMKKKVVTMLGIMMAVCMGMTACGDVATSDEVKETLQVAEAVASKNDEQIQDVSVEDRNVEVDDEEIAPLECFTYSENEDGTMTLVKYEGKTYTKIVIPEEVDGKKVVKIDNGVFDMHDEIIEVVMPDTIREIDKKAFYLATSLKKINLSKNLESIGERCFASTCIEEFIIPDTVVSVEKSALLSFGCRKIEISKGLTELPSTFAMETLIESITIPANIKVVHDNAFLSCRSLKEVVFEDGTELIETMAFKNCSALEKVSLPNTLKVIEEEAFYECDSLTEISIPEGTTEIGEDAFAKCYALKSVYIPASVTAIWEDAFFATAKDLTIYTPAGSAAESYAIENEITYVNQ